MICRRPRSELRAYVDLVWSAGAQAATSAGARELSLPGGSHHIVIRTGAPLRIFGSADDRAGEEIGTAIVGGMRLRAVHKALDREPSVGAVLRPDALGLMCKLAPAEFAGGYVSLTEIWNTGEVEDGIAHIQAGATHRERLQSFERMLMQLFEGASAPDPRMRHALLRLDRGAKIDPVAAEVGFSHRHFCARFREMVGLLPVDYRQVRRFDRLIASLSRPKRRGLAEVALMAGYCDQSHMAREFRAFSGLSVREYGRLAKTQARHVPLPD